MNDSHLCSDYQMEYDHPMEYRLPSRQPPQRHPNYHNHRQWMGDPHHQMAYRLTPQPPGMTMVTSGMNMVPTGMNMIQTSAIPTMQKETEHRNYLTQPGARDQHIGEQYRQSLEDEYREYAQRMQQFRENVQRMQQSLEDEYSEKAQRMKQSFEDEYLMYCQSQRSLDKQLRENAQRMQQCQTQMVNIQQQTLERLIQRQTLERRIERPSVPPPTESPRKRSYDHLCMPAAPYPHASYNMSSSSSLWTDHAQQPPPPLPQPPQVLITSSTNQDHVVDMGVHSFGSEIATVGSEIATERKTKSRRRSRKKASTITDICAYDVLFGVGNQDQKRVANRFYADLLIKYGNRLSKLVLLDENERNSRAEEFAQEIIKAVSGMTGSFVIFRFDKWYVVDNAAMLVTIVEALLKRRSPQEPQASQDKVETNLPTIEEYRTFIQDQIGNGSIDADVHQEFDSDDLETTSGAEGGDAVDSLHSEESSKITSGAEGDDAVDSLNSEESSKITSGSEGDDDVDSLHSEERSLVKRLSAIAGDR